MDTNTQREAMEYDVVIVGAGPAGLSTSIKLKQLNENLNVCIVEKASEVGAHILSGNVLETRALDELLPDWKNMDGCPLKTKVTKEKFLFLFEKSSFTVPSFLLPPVQHNKGNYIASLANVCRWLGQIAENLGVEIYPGFAASEVLYHEDGSIKGVATNDMGIDINGEKKDSFEPGIELHAKVTVFSEGCRGHLGKQVISKFNLDENSDPQQYGIGLKEIWEVPEENHDEGLVFHSAGWPLDNQTYGGSFVYHAENRQIFLGYVLGLDYSNPHMSPFEEFQRFKTHPFVKKIFDGGRRISYGARALNEGGWQSLPKLSFPGGALVGCDAGTLNTPKIKGTHTAMKSGMIASSEVFNELSLGKKNSEITHYQKHFVDSWAGIELKKARNVRPSFKYGMKIGMILTGIDQILFKGNAPWTLKHGEPDHLSLKEKKYFQPIQYPKPDGKITFDKLTNVSFSSTYHEENQPCHLKIIDDNIPISNNYKLYDSPEQRYCPAGVYEILSDNGKPSLQINSQNCIHCKTCDIKDPLQNINWVSPEGGGGPNYTNM